MILTVLQFVIQYVNLPSVTPHVLNPRMQFAMLNVKSLNVKLNALIKVVKCSTVLNVLQYANLLIVLLTAKLLSQNVNQFAKNLNAIGNVISLLVLNPNASLFAKIPTVSLKLNVVHVL
jgi:hypothetical protein